MLGFLELPKEEVPPELIWHHDSRMTEWWQAVEDNRKTPGSASRDVEVDQTENELAKEFRSG